MAQEQIPQENETHRISHFLRRVGIDVRLGEGRLAVLFCAYYATLFICFYTVKVVRQSTFVESLGAAKLPIAYLLVALCSYPALKIYDRFVRRLPIPRLIVVSNVLQAGVALLFWLGFAYQLKWLPVFYYVWMTISFGIFISQFWTYTGSVFDPRQAKRLFTIIAAGGALGGILGGQTAYWASLVAGPFGGMAAIALSLLLMAGLVLAIERLSQKKQTAGMHKIAPEEKPQGGISLLKQSPYIRYLALMTFASVIVVQIVDMQFNWAVERAVTDFSERTKLFGHFFSLISITAFLFLLVLTSQVHKRLGVASAMRLLPVTIGLGTLGMLGAEVFFPAAVVWAACVLKIGEGGVRHSIEQVTRELLYLPVDSAWRAQAKATIDIFIQRFSKGAAALMLLTVSFGWLSIAQVGILSLILVTIWLVLTFPAHRFYIQHYRQGLQSGSLEDAQVNCEDAQTIELLVASLGSQDSAKVLHAMELLRKHGRGKLVPPILLRHDDADVRLKTLSVLIEAQRRDAEPLILECLGDDNQAVRAEAVRALAALQEGDVCNLMLTQLRVADPRVRSAAVVSLVTRGTAAHLGEARKALFDLCGDADFEVRIEACRALGALPEPTFQDRLIQLLYDRHLDVVKEAICAVQIAIECMIQILQGMGPN
jgi:AAA family ATP:ADP antiporter